MKEVVKCIILSHNRPDDVITHQLINHTAICVPEAQAAAYEGANYGVELIVHPDTVVGLSAKIRWVYDQYRNVCMLDDDLNRMVRLYVDKYSDEGNHVEPEEAYQIIQANARMAQQLGVKFFGFSNSPKPVSYLSAKPFKLSGFVQGGALCFLDGFQMVLPDECVSACDYFLSGVNAHFHRKTLIDTRYAFASPDGTFRSTGGTADYRNMDTEKEDTQLLLEYFGDVIHVKNNSGVKKLQHIYERTLRIPF